MKKIASVVLSVLAMTFLASCGGDVAASAAGKYTLDTVALEADMAALMKAAMPADAPTEGPAFEAAAALLKKQVAGFSGTFDLKADNTCVVSIAANGQKEDVAGTWKLDSGQLSITGKLDGKDDTKLFGFADGVISKVQGEGAMQITLKFRKAAK